ncbi:MAG: T9SS type A sorting domain-containing protein [Bacteroidales bacterium]|nr:T9SS type A sorting domain-containing protein [Bacteroidales bacterium]
MKKILFTFALTLLSYSFSFAQQEEDPFLEGFLPVSRFYDGHHGNTDSHYLLDNLYWDVWEDVYGAGGVYGEELHHYRHDFSYLPNGDIHQILQYENNAGSWKLAYKHTYEYDDQNKMTTYTQYYRHYNGGWAFDYSFDFTYDKWDHVIVKHGIAWDGSEGENQYEYDNAGNLISDSYFMSHINTYFDRWLYNYEEGKLANKCYQQYYTSSGWVNFDLYQYTYDGENISSILHQEWSIGNSHWYNVENVSYEYDNGIVIQELFQVWQNGEWVDKSVCNHEFDEFGNSIAGRWKDKVNGTWVDSEDNHSLLVQYNNGGSLLSESVRSYQATYSYLVGIDESSSSLQVEAFPNPGTDQFTIQAETPFSNVIVYDLTGRQVCNQAVFGNIIRINTDNWPSGAYFWKAYDSNSAQSGKWVKN